MVTTQVGAQMTQIFKTNTKQRSAAEGKANQTNHTNLRLNGAESLPQISQIYTDLFLLNTCNEMMNDEYLWKSVKSVGDSKC